MRHGSVFDHEPAGGDARNRDVRLQRMGAGAQWLTGHDMDRERPAKWQVEASRERGEAGVRLDLKLVTAHRDAVEAQPCHGDEHSWARAVLDRDA